MLVSLLALLVQSLLRSCLRVDTTNLFGLPFLFMAPCLKYRIIALRSDVLVSLLALLVQSLLRSCLRVDTTNLFGLPFLFMAPCLKYRIIALLADVLEPCLIKMFSKSLHMALSKVRVFDTSPVLL